MPGRWSRQAEWQGMYKEGRRKKRGSRRGPPLRGARDVERAGEAVGGGDAGGAQGRDVPAEPPPPPPLDGDGSREVCCGSSRLQDYAKCGRYGESGKRERLMIVGLGVWDSACKMIVGLKGRWCLWFNCYCCWNHWLFIHRWKGWKISDMMFVTKRGLADGCNIVQPLARRGVVEDDGDEQVSVREAEAILALQIHKESLDELYEWDKELYEEVKCRVVRLQEDQGCHQDPRTKLSISLAFKRTRAAIKTSGPSSTSPLPPSTPCPGGLSPSATMSCCLLP